METSEERTRRASTAERGGVKAAERQRRRKSGGGEAAKEEKRRRNDGGARRGGIDQRSEGEEDVGVRKRLTESRWKRDDGTAAEWRRSGGGATAEETAAEQRRRRSSNGEAGLGRVEQRNEQTEKVRNVLKRQWGAIENRKRLGCVAERYNNKRLVESKEKKKKWEEGEWETGGRSLEPVGLGWSEAGVWLH